MNYERRHEHLVYKVIAAFCVVTVAVMLVSIYMVGILPIKYFAVTMAGILIITIPTIYILFKSRTGNIRVERFRENV